MEKSKLIISGSPHINASIGLRYNMWNVVIALIPALSVSVYFFGLNSVRVVLIAIAACLLTEFIFLKLRKRAPDLLDGSCVVTALLYALILPAGLPSWMVALGGIFAVVFGKHVFGGLGFNIFNPALVGRAFLVAAYPVAMTAYPPVYNSACDAVTSATPLGLAKFSAAITPIRDLFWGSISGSLGETCAFALILGAAYLLIAGVIKIRVPLYIILSYGFLQGVFWLINPVKFYSPLFGILSGGFLIGALFMATDPVTSPVTKKGRCVFGIGIGLIVFIIRSFSGLPEGMMYSILIMNSFSPLINRLTLPRRFGR
ncbi:MAG: RnfABCDGE type electron transport complex subunit D [Candidatus Omnitrophica bacterium]|nr:RnfABCDGE type electron transport complex subunit D [Candidatus Omnitrophota bacterium]